MVGVISEWIQFGEDLIDSGKCFFGTIMQHSAVLISVFVTVLTSAVYC